MVHQRVRPGEFPLRSICGARTDLEKRRLHAAARVRHRPSHGAHSTPTTPDSSPNQIVASICAYEEEGNIAGVLDKMPTSIDGMAYTTLVVVDGGDDRTAEIARIVSRRHRH